MDMESLILKLRNCFLALAAHGKQAAIVRVNYTAFCMARRGVDAFVLLR